MKNSTGAIKFICHSMIGFFLIAHSYAQPNSNPSLGWSWSKSEVISIDQDKTKFYLHYKLQKKVDSPAVLIGHDNGGISQNEITFANYLYDQGFSVFLNDRITSRKRVARPLERFIIEDTFASVAYIKEQFLAKIKVDRLSFASFSGDGGFGALMLIEPKARNVFDNKTPDKFKVHKVVAIYPHCLHMKDGNPDTAALIIGAELDGSDPVVCQKAYANFPQVKVEIYMGAYHGFDQAGLKQKTWINKPVIMPGNCEWTIDLDSPRERQGASYFMLSTPEGVLQSSPEFSRYSATCSTNKAGYFSEYRDDFTQQAFKSSAEFMKN
jgi:dienelactone hydrolase